MTRTELMNMDRIEFDSEELDVAAQWHGGQSSMLYAITSTGALSRGTIRPRTDCGACGGFKDECPECHGRGQPMTDDQWLAHLASELESEAEECAEQASKTALEDVDALEGIATKCREAIAKLGGAS